MVRLGCWHEVAQAAAMVGKDSAHCSSANRVVCCSESQSCTTHHILPCLTRALHQMPASVAQMESTCTSYCLHTLFCHQMASAQGLDCLLAPATPKVYA